VPLSTIFQLLGIQLNFFNIPTFLVFVGTKKTQNLKHHEWHKYKTSDLYQ
jgi:hypothetical protein